MDPWEALPWSCRLLVPASRLLWPLVAETLLDASVGRLDNRSCTLDLSALTSQHLRWSNSLIQKETYDLQLKDGRGGSIVAHKLSVSAGPYVFSPLLESLTHVRAI